ncbi:DUF2303 family protein [Xylella taiwanensis]|uniref:DUF2303 family protein n=1 Tax=Xylella taiwanensis TaxID=1444770 RepID=Z9JK55_9GAMM|nr:DUF2303 family protein [Xylella taiwanensis]AXI83141.1 hypothetical protein AB672_03885 [Xylella taiwanensis]EWS78805.1 hypothetical protein AF72_04330 [Xylella taiwanensis]MCD8456190.1 DUF2303 family protein [Xylella taiwanensis]MCD8458598.1 DUF2303 family protein [Xylella taiwanensis]MCD8460732.1 DUF2303 family protein [Xylella taiwanensis]
MNKTAIELIQQTAIDANARRLPDVLGNKAIALPENYNLHYLEKFYERRFRFRGALETKSIADFVQYVKTKDKSEGFIDADTLSAKVFFNLGTSAEPGHADWTAALTLQATAAYKALLSIDGRALNQRQLIDWLEDWAPLLSAFMSAFSQEAGDLIPLTTAITAIRKLTIKATSESEFTQGDFKVSRSKFDAIEARSSLGLPTGFTFTFTTEPYLGLPSRTFRLRLSVLTEDDKPSMVLRIVQREAHEEAITQDFKTVLFRELDGVATLTIGTFSP